MGFGGICEEVIYTALTVVSGYLQCVIGINIINVNNDLQRFESSVGGSKITVRLE